MEATILLVDGLHGIHCIKRLIENYELFSFKGQLLDADDTADLLNPETSDDAFDWIEPSVRIEGEQYNVQWRDGELIGVHVDALWSYHLDDYYVATPTEIEYTIPQYVYDALQSEAWSADSEYWENQIAYYGDEGKEDYKRFRSWFDMRKKHARAIMAGRWRAVDRDEFAHYNDVDHLGNTVYTVLVEA